MEKQGVISHTTPSESCGRCDGSCSKKASERASLDQLTAAEADKLEAGVTKDLADAVRRSSPAGRRNG